MFSIGFGAVAVEAGAASSCKPGSGSNSTKMIRLLAAPATAPAP
jgi:hypothetical protein